MTHVPASQLSPQSAVSRLGEMSPEVRAAVLLDDSGELTASAGSEGDDAGRLGELAARLFETAELAGRRAGVESVGRVEVARRDGGVFGVRRSDGANRRWTLVAVTAAGALPSLVLYDLWMTLSSMDAR